jgi:hypothetical protein
MHLADRAVEQQLCFSEEIFSVELYSYLTATGFDCPVPPEVITLLPGSDIKHLYKAGKV